MDELDQRLEEFRLELDSRYAPGSITQEVDRLEGWKRKVNADSSFGRIFNGPQWLDGVSVRDGTVGADKLQATMVISSVFTTAESPADRVQFDSVGFAAYGTVGGVPNTQTLLIEPDGSFQFGPTGSDPITYDVSTDTLTVPAAVIGSLTIADIAGGVVGGTYATGIANPKIQFATSGISAWNAGGTQTFLLDATTGDLTITGTFTIQSAASGSRIALSSTGARWYNGSTVRAQILNDGSGFVGSTTGIAGSAAVSWTTAGTATINASNITTGTLSGTTVTITNLNATNINTGSLNGSLLSSGSVANAAIDSVAFSKVTTGSITSQTLTISSGGSIVLSSTGTISWNGTSSFIDSTKMRLSSSSSANPAIQFYTSGASQGTIYSSSGSLRIGGPGAFINLTSTMVQTGGPIHVGSTGFTQLDYGLKADSGPALFYNSHTFKVDSTGRAIASGNFFPQGQTTYYVGASSSLQLAGPVDFLNHTTGGSTANWSSAGPATSYITVKIAGTNRRIPFYADA